MGKSHSCQEYGPNMGWDRDLSMAKVRSHELRYHWYKYISRLELLNYVVQSCKLYDLYQEQNFIVIKNLLNYIGFSVEVLAVTARLRSLHSWAEPHAHTQYRMSDTVPRSLSALY